jgi:hypothetical protein
LPVNFQQALQQIREMGSQATLREERLQELRAEAGTLLLQYACQLDSLEQLVLRAAEANSWLRCAAPFEECLDQTFPTPAIDSPYVLLAADGSQINPDRHAMVEFGAINVGAIRLQPGTGQPPQEMVHSQLMFHDDLFTASGNLLTDDLVALKRDLAERQVLADLARRESASVLALTDGPLELFREPRGMPEFEAELERYQQVLEDLARLEVGTAGYVDRPRGDLVVRLLELVILQRRGQISKAGTEHPLRGVFDTTLFWNLLKPGERSAIFAIRSGSSKSFQGSLALHFFYLNVGRADHPYLARVEVPRWVAENKRLVNLLHACLVEQAHHLGAAPYPYILHRAHEIAVISWDERSQLESMIAAELYRQGQSVDDRSNKQTAKNASSTHTRSR